MPGVKPSYLLLTWAYEGNGGMNLEGKGLARGKTVDGFALESDDLPGIATVKMRGDQTTTAWLGHVPPSDTAVGKQVAELQDNDFVPSLGVVPYISASDPFDAGVALDNLRTHIANDIVELKLIEPTLASELDRILQAAVDAIRRNSTKAARDHLRYALKLVRKARPDDDDEEDDEEDDNKQQGKPAKTHPIDRLAARVIAFDIKYVEKRLKN